MKFVSTPLIFAILAAGTTVDAGFFSPIKNGISQTLQQPGWMLASMMRGGSMAKLFVNATCRSLASFLSLTLKIPPF